MVEAESESYSDIELDMPPKLTFEELRQQVMKDPPLARKRLDLLRTLYYYSKDSKWHSYSTSRDSSKLVLFVCS